jgi:hypothetical protein
VGKDTHQKHPRVTESIALSGVVQRGLRGSLSACAFEILVIENTWFSDAKAPTQVYSASAWKSAHTPFCAALVRGNSLIGDSFS